MRQELVAFDAQLARLASVVDRITLGQNLAASSSRNLSA